MRYMNDYDRRIARQRFTRASCPNRLALAIMVDRLADWADHNSDGWAYWAKPARSADKAMALIESRTSRENDAQEREDITEEELAAAVRPVKAFLTRMAKISHPLHTSRALVTADDRELILRSTQPLFQVL